MDENPLPLQELCMQSICEHLTDVFEVYYTTSPSGNSEEKYRLKDGDMLLPNELSEMLFTKLVEKNILCDSTLNIFSEKNTRLRKVQIKNARKITADGMKMIKQHKIINLECINVKDICISKILECISEWSLKNMTNLNLSQCTFIDLHRYSLTIDLTNLKHLRSLDVSYTELNQETLKLICEDLKILERLNISGTRVQDLSPLLMISDQLTSLAVSDLKSINEMTDIILCLHSLRHLDVSLVNEKLDDSERTIVGEIISKPDCLKHLVFLDISGWTTVITRGSLEMFVLCHPNLKYLGIIMNSVAFELPFSDPNSPYYRHDLVIAGLGNESQIKVTLKRHFEKPLFVQKALYHLYQLASSLQGARLDIAELVLLAMGEHPTKFNLQLMATACLCKLIHWDISKNVHPKLLGRGVTLILNAMENFPEEYHLQKNCLVNLCSDRILREVSFDRFRCAKLVLETLHSFDETYMNRMAVTILAAKVLTAETSKLGARPEYTRKLLAMVQSPVHMRLSDITVKFTLSTLWNLTDGSAETRKVFLEHDGVMLFLNVLKTFRNDNTIETKVLGLLNNIAEVEELRHSLMLNTLIEELFTLLKSEHIDVSYFAAGIVAHLASDGADRWSVWSFSRVEMLKELESAVTQWKVPDSEMVAYRSFKPFFPLLRKDMDYRVQLWAVWAIYHVCNKNPKHYCLMLCEENGIELLKDLLVYEESHPVIQRISSQILETLEINVY